MTPGTNAVGGNCALHPDRASQATCARCGNFMCATCCSGGAETQCPACRQRTGIGTFPFHRGDYSFDRLWNYSFEAWKRQWVMLSVGLLLLGGIYLTGAVVMQVFIGGSTALLTGVGKQPDQLGPAFVGIFGSILAGYTVLFLVVGVAAVGLMRMFGDVLMGKPADVSVLFSQFSKAGRAAGLLLMMMGMILVPYIVFGGLIGAMAAMGALKSDSFAADGPGLAQLGGMMAVAGIGGVVFIVAITWISLPFIFAMLELAHSDAGAVECLKRGFSLSKGYRWQILGYRLLGGVIASAGALACCVGVLPAAALAYLLETSLYLAVRNGSGLPGLGESGR